MRVAILAFGSRGDTQPCAALARELVARDHGVTLVAAGRYAGLAGPGMTFAPLGVDPEAVVHSERGQAWLRSGPLGFVRGFSSVVEPLAAQLVAEVDAACADADLVLAPALGAFGRHLHDKYGIPYLIMQFQPSEPTGEFPNPLVPFRTLGAWGNRASYAVVERLAWTVLARTVDRLRSSVLGLGPLRGSPFEADRRAGVRVLCGVSPLVVPRPHDWPEYVHLTGYWRLERPDRELDPDLRSFLVAGRAPVYVGFGSMTPADPHRVAAQVVAGLRLAGLRGVVQGLPVEAADDVHPIDGDVAHERLFPLMMAVVHHGGAGTTGTALTAGVPSVVCPFFSDQPFWGRRVSALGVGPPPLPIGALTAGKLGERLRDVLEYHARARQLARLLRVEDGVKRAVDLVERSWSSR
ncbi:glycosyltransferase family 1 protein [Nonomuraea sp. NN258]|uniref:glycosyltransferase n=1 Tax=Nonomuraea antri TaxID=2730852 RepID=UPI001569F506|nr:glycosyltransferase [Nonomuraea antri]NRQ40148.1 glycosyltransferase family 1 protein [Nonomuraea antri]